MKLKLDLHDIYNRGRDIDQALQDIIDEAVRIKAPLVEIIPGKGSGQLKKHVLRFLDRKDIKALLPPGREGLQELRPGLRPLPLEVTARLEALEQNRRRPLVSTDDRLSRRPADLSARHPGRGCRGRHQLGRSIARHGTGARRRPRRELPARGARRGC